MILEFEIPGLPKMTNGLRVHWRVKHNEGKKWKAMVHEAVFKLPNRPATPFLKATLTLTRFSSREPDADGLVSSWKNLIDALVEAEIIIDDRPSVIGFPNFKWEYASPRKGKVRMRVEAA